MPGGSCNAWRVVQCLGGATPGNLLRTSRRKALEHCAGAGARLMPCHFGAPFTCHIDHKGDGFVPRFDGGF